MKICIVLGTRPEIIKCCPVIKELQKQKINFFIIHSNQHYSKNMDKVIFDDLELPQPKYNLGIGSANHGNMTGRMMVAIEEILLKEKPDFVLSQGDTNTVLAGILSASKQNIKTGHIEAGLRSYDRRMPEEKNRILCDAISDYLFCPTKIQQKILKGEGIEKEKIFVVGNTVVDALLQNIKIAEQKSKILEKLKVKPKEYILFTAHRDLNVDYKESLEKLIKIVDKLKAKTKCKVIYPIHPRTKNKLKEFKLKIKNAILIDPLGYLDFIRLEKNAKMIVTDSGGLQEEACTFGVPCITIRENTERPETVDVGANKIVALNMKKVDSAIKYFSRNRKWKNPFGDGTTSKQIIEVLKCQK